MFLVKFESKIATYPPIIISAKKSSYWKKWAIPGLFFFIFVFSIQLTVNVRYKFLPMTGFEPRTSGIGSNRSTNWATTTAHKENRQHGALAIIAKGLFTSTDGEILEHGRAGRPDMVHWSKGFHLLEVPPGFARKWYTIPSEVLAKNTDINVLLFKQSHFTINRTRRGQSMTNPSL